MDKGFKESIIELRKNGKTVNEIVKILGCAKSTVAYHCGKINLKSVHQLSIITDDIVHEMKILYNELQCSKKVANKLGLCHVTVKKYLKDYLTKRIYHTKETKKKAVCQSVISCRKKNKQRLVEYKGGKCIICGYNKCNRALEFHHLDRNNKSFSISNTNIKYEKLQAEVDKCILVCSNCHCEIEDGLIDLLEYLS